MCLLKIRRRTMPEEGIGYKVYEKTSLGLKSMYIRDLVLSNQWMLHKNPDNNCTHDCNIGRKKFFGLFGKKERYEHGFHLWKTLESAEQSLMSYRIQESISGRKCPYVLVEVHYRGYIAEDSSEVVVKQIFVSIPEESTTVVKDGKIVGVSIS